MAFGALGTLAWASPGEPLGSSCSAKLGKGLVEDTLVLLTELLRLTRFSRADMRLFFGRFNSVSASTRPGID